eukprot:6202261-Pleurochrysis_carterae.AAC.2
MEISGQMWQLRRKFGSISSNFCSVARFLPRVVVITIIVITAILLSAPFRPGRSRGDVQLQAWLRLRRHRLCWRGRGAGLRRCA